MKIAYDNLYSSDNTLTATNENTNFSVSNVYHRFLALPFRSLDNTETEIELVFSTTIEGIKDLTVFHMLNSNIKYSMKIQTYTYLDVLKGELQITDIGSDNLTVYFDPDNVIFQDVGKVKLIIAADISVDYFEIGSLFIGDSLDFPYIKTPSIKEKLKGSFKKTNTGQITGAAYVNLKTFGVDVKSIDSDKKSEIESFLLNVNINKPFFLDVYDYSLYDQKKASIDFNTTYVNLVKFGTWKKDTGKFLYNIDFDFEECK